MLMLIFSELKQLMTNFKIWLIDWLIHYDYVYVCKTKKGFDPYVLKKKKDYCYQKLKPDLFLYN